MPADKPRICIQCGDPTDEICPTCTDKPVCGPCMLPRSQRPTKPRLRVLPPPADVDLESEPGFVPAPPSGPRARR